MLQYKDLIVLVDNSYIMQQERKWLAWPECVKGKCGEWITVKQEKPKLTTQQTKIRIGELKTHVAYLQKLKQDMENIVRERSAPANQWFWYEVVDKVLVPELSALQKELKRLEWQLPTRRMKLLEGSITEEHIERVKQVMLTNFIEVNRAGFAQCNFHNEKTASFKYYKNNNSFYCYGCNAGGDVIAFIMKSKNLSFIETIKYLLKM